MGSQGKSNGKQQSPSLNALATQGPSCDLITLKELQEHLCEPLHSMNLNSLLNNVFPAEEDRSLMIDLESPSPDFSSASGLDRQSSLALVRAISNKTVEEVWREIQQPRNGFADEPNLAATLEEMTLDDFLLKAGVVSERFSKNQNSVACGIVGSVDGRHGCPQEIQFLQHYHQLPSLREQQQQTKRLFLNVCGPNQPSTQLPILRIDGVSDAGFPETQRTLPSAGLRILSDTSPNRKRVASQETVEKTVQRKQKRMIKNRESAARSRARKQAYTNELENKIARLEEENSMLKKKEELKEKLNDESPLPEPKCRLRRTLSCLF